MRVSTSDRLGNWIRGLGLLTLVVLAWSAFAPGGFFWTAMMAAGVIGTAPATALLVRSRRVPSLADVIASAEVEPVVGGVGGKG